MKVAVEAERLTRRKHGRTLWYEDGTADSIQYCLTAAGVERSEIAEVVTHDLLPYRTRKYVEDLGLTVYSHHDAHAASVCMLAPPETDVAIIVFDGMGSILDVSREGTGPVATRETFSFFGANGDRLERWAVVTGKGCLEEHTDFGNGVSNSLGCLYELVSSMLGFGLFDSGKTMGLAAWGRPRYLDLFERHGAIGASLEDLFTFDPFGGFVDELRAVLGACGNSFAVKADVAASLQELFNRVVLKAYEILCERRFDILALVGGCALNTVANGVLTRLLKDEHTLLVPPHAGDAGTALGALWLRNRELGGGSRITVRGRPAHPNIARPGRHYRRREIQSAANSVYPSVVRDASVSQPADIAALLAAGHIIGVVNEGSEIGPRALGGRSILTDPRDVMMREYLNRHIKLREPFRPLAPMVLEEHFDEWFTPPKARDYFMLNVADATERCRALAPAVVHVDGTARAQIVDDESDPFIAAVIREFHRLTGVPIVLNTSLNGEGEPIVESPGDAFRALLKLDLDGLYVQGEYYVSAHRAASRPSRVRETMSGITSVPSRIT